MGRIENIKKYSYTSDQSREEAAKNGRKGGFASGKVRRAKKSMKETIDKILSIKIKDDELEAQLQTFGLKKSDMTYNSAVIVAQLVRALKGDTKAAEFLRDTSGQKVPTEISDEAVSDHNDAVAIINAMMEEPPRQRSIEDFEREEESK